MAQGINGALAEHQPVIFRPDLAEPQALASTRREARIAAVLDFVAAQPVPVEMRKHGIAPPIHADPTGEAPGPEQGSGQGAFILKIRMASDFLHTRKFRIDAHAVLGSFGQGRESRDGSLLRLAEPQPNHFSRSAEAHTLTDYYKIEQRPVVTIIPHREINIMPVGIPLDENLVGRHRVTHAGGALIFQCSITFRPSWISCRRVNDPR